MKNFYQYLAPFAPDYSGASSVLYDAGGMIVMCDPGGCSGIIGGYDEPRFYGGRTPLYSAALREMDTIFGRDGRLVSKVVAAAKMDAPRFVALLAGPTISIIGSDLSAVARAIEQETSIPTFDVPTSGMHMYDFGARAAYLALLDRFMPTMPGIQPARHSSSADETIVFGATPLDMPGRLDIAAFGNLARKRFGDSTFIIGDDKTLDILAQPERIARSVVASPTGLAAARRLERELHIPCLAWFSDNPVFDEVIDQMQKADKRPEQVLIIHQQVVGDALRRQLEEAVPGTHADVASFFLTDDDLGRPGDIFLEDEDSFLELVTGDTYDTIVCDPFYGRALRDFRGQTFALSQVAVSGDFYL